MANETKIQPAKKSYFFSKGYKDLINTIKDAWIMNFASVRTYRDNISALDRTSKIKFILMFILNVMGLAAVIVFGTAITFVITIAIIAVLVAFMAFVFIGFSAIWIVDRLYLMRKKIFTACQNCKTKTLVPTYICKKCGAKHTNLTPSVYGILKRTCTGTDPNKYCGEILPTTFFNGRRQLEAECPHCHVPLLDKETVPICIPVVGGRSVGKTAFITAFSKNFIENIAPSKNWTTEFYNSEKADIYREIEQVYKTGSTRITERTQDINKASSVSFSFFIKGKEFEPERLCHIYDIAGEVFTQNDENEVQKQYEYCHGIVFVIDPFAIPSIRYRCEKMLTKEDIAGIGTADINSIVNSFLNKIREVTGLSEAKMLTVPLAVIISKTDSAGLDNEVGEAAIRSMMDSDTSKFSDYQDTQDYVCRKFLVKNGMESFVNNVSIKFKNNRFFSCSAIGHTRDAGVYDPKGVMPPMEWIFKNADAVMAKSWNDTEFSKKPLAIRENEK